MSPARLLDRNVRPLQRANGDEEDDVEEREDAVSEAGVGGGNEDPNAGSESDGSAIKDDHSSQGSAPDSDSDELEPEGEDVQHQISQISFGALKKAEDSASRKRKRGSATSPEHDDKLETLRARLRQIKEAKTRTADGAVSKSGVASFRSNAKPKTAQTEDDDDDDEESSSNNSDSDSAPSEEEAQPKSRASKHAPAAQSSRHQVTRKRTVVDVPKRIVRDPRFDAIQQRSSHTGSNTEKAYSFLETYQKSEIDELKAAIKRTKDEDDKTTLRRKVVSMENKFKAKAAKDREQDVLRAHRREEKVRVEAGKQPYYLKRKEVKERALVEKFKGMKAKEREKVVERRRKKEGQKEKKRMPNARRVMG